MESSDSREIILITGITGYIGSHVGQTFLEQCVPEFSIRASVRSLANKKKLEPLEKEFGDKFSHIEWVEAELTNKLQLAKAVQGVAYIIHVASPVPGATNLSEQQMLEPAR